MQSINSDRNSDWLASQCFNNILNQIQDSCLNFHVQLTPFGAKISLKKSFIRDKKGAVILPFTKYEPEIVRNDEEKVPAAKAEKDVEDNEKRNEKNAEGVANDMPVKKRDVEAGNAINYDDEVDKEDEYDEDENNDEENVIEEMESIYNVSVANYFSPLMITSSPDILVTTHSPMYLSSPISSVSDSPRPQLAQLPGPQEHQLGVGQDDDPREKTSESK